MWLLIQSLHGILITPSTESCLILQKLNVQKAAKIQKDKTFIQNKELQTVSLDVKHPSNGSSTNHSKRGKDAKKVHVCSDRIKRAEQRLQIGNSFKPLAELEDDDMAISHDIQKPSVMTKIIPILPTDD